MIAEVLEVLAGPSVAPHHAGTAHDSHVPVLVTAPAHCRAHRTPRHHCVVILVVGMTFRHIKTAAVHGFYFSFCHFVISVRLLVMTEASRMYFI